MAGTLGRWTVEQEAAPGRLSLRKPVGSALLLGRDLAYLGILSGFAYGLATSVDAIWSNGGQSGRTWLVVGFLVLAGLVLFVGRKVVQGLFNVLRLQVADGKLVLQSGPLPRWTRHALELEWIVSVEVDWTDNETEAPGLEFTLRNGTTERFPFPQCWRADLDIAAEQVRAALVPGQPTRA